jgi:predicted DNA-binding transcriptional regulator AlpA/predicted nucleotidyltransferase
MEYTFTLKYQLSELDCIHDELVERLGAGGCDDSVIGLGMPGRIALEFSREAVSAEDAIRSALSDVKSAIPTAKLTEVEPDFVGLTDVAEMIGMSRQNMRKLMTNHSTTFPIPLHEGSVSIWHLADILDWLQAKGGYLLEQSVIDVAHVTKKINASKKSYPTSNAPDHFEKIVIDPIAVKRRVENGRREAAKIIASMRQKGVVVQLFGSMKTGKAFPNSDLDLLVTDCGPLDPEIVLADIHAMEDEIPLDVMLLQFIPANSLGRVMESLNG